MLVHVAMSRETLGLWQGVDVVLLFAAAVVVAAVVGPAAAAVVVMSELPISNILCLIFQVGIIGCPIAKHREYGVLA